MLEIKWVLGVQEILLEVQGEASVNFLHKREEEEKKQGNCFLHPVIFLIPFLPSDF